MPELDTRNTHWEQCRECKCWVPEHTHCPCNCRRHPTMRSEHEQMEARRSKMIEAATARRRNYGRKQRALAEAEA